MKPILFNTEMVRAILDGRKTVTRRVVPSRILDKYCDYDDYVTTVAPRGAPCIRTSEKEYYMIYAPCQIGDILYVRETWQKLESSVAADLNDNEYAYVYRASDNGQAWALNTEGWKWKPSIHMPKEAARIFLKVTDVRVERLQDITAEQADKEGVGNLFMAQIACSDIDGGYHTDLDSEYGVAKEQFAYLWDSTIKKNDLDQYGWDANPWVWVIEFEKCESEEIK